MGRASAIHLDQRLVSSLLSLLFQHLIYDCAFQPSMMVFGVWWSCNWRAGPIGPYLQSTSIRSVFLLVLFNFRCPSNILLHSTEAFSSFNIPFLINGFDDLVIYLKGCLGTHKKVVPRRILCGLWNQAPHLLSHPPFTSRMTRCHQRKHKRVLMASHSLLRCSPWRWSGSWCCSIHQ